MGPSERRVLVGSHVSSIWPRSEPGLNKYNSLPTKVYKISYDKNSGQWVKKLDEKALDDFRFPLWSESDNKLPKRFPVGAFGNFIVEFERPKWADLLNPKYPTRALRIAWFSYTSSTYLPTKNHFPMSLRKKYSNALPEGFTPYLPGSSVIRMVGHSALHALFITMNEGGSRSLLIDAIKDNKIYRGYWEAPHCGNEGAHTIFQRDLEPEDFDAPLPPSHDPSIDCDLNGDPNMGYGHPNPLAMNIQFEYPIYSLRACILPNYIIAPDLTPYSSWVSDAETYTYVKEHREEINQRRTLVDRNVVMFREKGKIGGGEI